LHRSYQRGLTLPETAAALVAFAVVVLSIATVHLERARAAPGLALREEAQRLANDMAAVIRSNRDPVVHYEDAVGVVCRKDISPTQLQSLANNEVACWRERVMQGLPNGEGAIATDPNTIPPAYVITVNWAQPGARGASYIQRVAKESSVDISKTAPLASSQIPSRAQDATRAAN
jgi:Tfp pilus assembly protein PilV